MTETIGRRHALKVGAVAGVASSMAAPAVQTHAAASVQTLRMVTSWPADLPGPGVSARRIGERISALTDGAVTVELHPAGTLVPALEVFDAVGAGLAELGHTASLFWTNKAPAAALFTAGPFGLTPSEHLVWLSQGGGQALWDRLYAPFGLKPLAGGNTGMQMGGWYRREISSVEDLRGAKLRMPGLGGAIMAELGATSVAIAPSEIFGALRSGVVDGAEFLGPWSDRALGLHQAAPFYMWPGFHEPNGTGELLINQQRWQQFSPALRAVITHAAAAEHAAAAAEADWFNADALNQLEQEDGVATRPWPADVLAAARDATVVVLDRLAAQGGITAEVVTSFRAVRSHLARWSTVSQQAFLAARD